MNATMNGTSTATHTDTETVGLRNLLATIAPDNRPEEEQPGTPSGSSTDKEATPDMPPAAPPSVPPTDTTSGTSKGSDGTPAPVPADFASRIWSAVAVIKSVRGACLGNESLPKESPHRFGAFEAATVLQPVATELADIASGLNNFAESSGVQWDHVKSVVSAAAIVKAIHGACWLNEHLGKGASAAFSDEDLRWALEPIIPELNDLASVLCEL